VDDRWLSDVRDVAGHNLYARADPSTVVVEVGGERQAVAEAALTGNPVVGNRCTCLRSVV
jgi:hypothetical protein